MSLIYKTFTIICVILLHSNALHAELQVGALKLDVTPPVLPVIVNGGMLTRSVDTINTPVNARVVILDDGKERIGIAVVDSCMLPRPLLDDVKALISQRTQLKRDRILISATHTHSAPSCMDALGTNADETYIAFLREKLVEAFVAAEKNLEPAKVGWGITQAAEFTALRRWIRRPDRVVNDPFGNPTVRANMHAASNWDDVTGPSGPEDPDLSLISFQALDGSPIAVIANFSMHYFSDTAISADYFGLFSEGFKQHLAAQEIEDHPPFVAMMSHGCSGDIWRRDYAQPTEARNDKLTIEEYTSALLEIALAAYHKIEYTANTDLAMAEERLTLNYRTPDLQRLEWAKRIVADMGDRMPTTTEEVYAREAIVLHDLQSTEIVVQALRIGEIGIVTTPNETYALTGLKLKLQSPLQKTMVIELANGGDGYIPPPEQHLLGGYNTWAARSAGLEVTAEPKIVQAGLRLLEEVTQTNRSVYQQPIGPAAQSLLDLKPVAYWRMDEFSGPVAADTSGNTHGATYDPGTVFFLEGPDSEQYTNSEELNRCAHFAGGRLHGTNPGLDGDFTVSMQIWNGMPTDGREVTGWFFSFGPDLGSPKNALHVGLGGKENHLGQIIVYQGDKLLAHGETQIERWTWNDIRIVVKENSVQVWRNGKPELHTEISALNYNPSYHIFIGGHCSNQENWEGRIDEVVFFNKALTAEMTSNPK